MEVVDEDGVKYNIIENPDGTTSLKTYDEKYKMWLKINFAKEKDVEAENALIKMLCDLYIERVTGITQ